MAGFLDNWEGGMEIDRRRLLAGVGGFALVGWAGSPYVSSLGDTTEVAVAPSWQPLTQSLLDRARRVSTGLEPVDTVGVERVIRDLSVAQGHAKPPVIEWRADPFDAFAHLSSYGLDALLQMNNAQLWRRAGPKADLDDDRLKSHLVLGGVIGDIVRASEYDSV